jgi:hypothetical protein
MSESESSKSGFRQQLSDEISSRISGVRKQEEVTLELAHERALARFDNERWNLKGGAAMQLLFANARPTVDLDLVLKDPSLLELDANQRTNGILEAVRGELGKDKSDHFTFEARTALALSDLPPTTLAAMVLVSAKIDGEKFADLRIDVGIEQEEILPAEKVEGRNLMAFAQIPNPEITVVPAEVIFAEKLLAYVNARDDEHSPDFVPVESERVKDFIDIQMLAERGLSKESLAFAMYEVFRQFGRELPEEIEKPPERWQSQYSELASLTRVEKSMDNAHDSLVYILGPVLQQARGLSSIERTIGSRFQGVRGLSSGERALQSQIDSGFVRHYEDSKREADKEDRDDLV